METKTWEDTVIKVNFELRRKYCPAIIDNEGGHGDWSIEKLLDDQAGISFKAGQREVVEFIKEGGYLMGDKWEAQLKEWGL